MHWLLFCFFFFAIVIGWVFGRYGKSKPKPEKSPLSRNYFVGLNYLLNEQPDKAVDIFIRMLDVDSDTVETHLAIGSLFRRRGEVERAIRVHQNLIARPNLNKTLRVQALLELGRDYMHAGVYDRAERLFLEAIDIGGHQSALIYRYLLTIYQYEKDWPKAIIYAQKLAQETKEDMGMEIANYYCESLEHERKKLTFEQQRQYVKSALDADKKSVRATLLEAKLYRQEGDIRTAIKTYKRVSEQDPDYLSEAIEPIKQCYKELNDEPGLVDYLYQCLNECPRLPVILTITNYLQETQGLNIAIDFLTSQLQQYPSLRGIEQLMQLLSLESKGSDQQNLRLVQNLLKIYLQAKPVYQCQHCGFRGKTLLWLCPGCKYWNTVKPIHGLEGD